MAVTIASTDRGSAPGPPSLASGTDHRCDGGVADGADHAEHRPRPQPQMQEAPRVDPVTHRTDVVRRLIDRGVTVRALEALLPGWEGAISEALDTRHRSGS